MKSYVLALTLLLSSLNVFSQVDYQEKKNNAESIYPGSIPYDVKITEKKRKKRNQRT